MGKRQKRGHRSKRQGFPGSSIRGVRREIRTLSRQEWDIFTFRLNQLQQPIVSISSLSRTSKPLSGDEIFPANFRRSERMS